ncbi:Forkhead box protein like [Actinidia chinensis var. chinensis]|uniref:Forkhead box protein like n=1 Tax=Actinidia chinensis var. chinensis TaxID=1590841 RepID=A0A2R6PXC2_ACTCC|nr:Forkhead box protein like [Actinidia chinensis var. chinensis]
MRCERGCSGESKMHLNLPDSSTGGLVENSTGGSVFGCEFYDTSTATTTQTPQVQASVSPDIQCGSSMLVSSATPTCYGARHIVSGVGENAELEVFLPPEKLILVVVKEILFTILMMNYQLLNLGCL